MWSVSKEWRTIYLILLAINVIVATVFISWYEISVRDADAAAETAIAILKTISQVYVGIAIGTAVVVDVIVICKTVFTSAKGVIRLLSDLLKDALRKQEERLAEEERRQEEVAALRRGMEESEERRQEEVATLRRGMEEAEERRRKAQQRITELEQELGRRRNGS